jgi:hypothetical protein
MRRQLVSVVLAISMIGGLVSTVALASPAPAGAQEAGEPLPDPGDPELPPEAVPGSTPEREAAWEGATQQEQDEAVAMFRDQVIPQAAQAAQEAGSAQTEDEAVPSWRDVFTGQADATDPSAPEPVFTNDPPPTALAATAEAVTAETGSDQDVDGLPESFEDTLADAFTPAYHVSTGEKSGTGFARFKDSLPLEVQTVLPPTPPISHFRVTPQGFTHDNRGTLLGVLRIDYLTLWNRDDGLNFNTICAVLSPALALVGQLIGRPHDFDNERSAALVAAPVAGTSAFNLDPGAYKSYA